MKLTLLALLTILLWTFILLSATLIAFAPHLTELLNIPLH